jgi:hypothetical protein
MEYFPYQPIQKQFSYRQRSTETPATKSRKLQLLSFYKKLSNVGCCHTDTFERTFFSSSSSNGGAGGGTAESVRKRLFLSASCDAIGDDAYPDPEFSGGGAGGSALFVPHRLFLSASCDAIGDDAYPDAEFSGGGGGGSAVLVLQRLFRSAICEAMGEDGASPFTSDVV